MLQPIIAPSHTSRHLSNDCDCGSSVISDGLGAEYFRRMSAATARITALAAEIARSAPDVWETGDGYGGSVRRIIDSALAHLPQVPQGLDDAPVVGRSKGKREIGNSLRTKVYERDAYRCRGCGTHLALTCDHVVPESKGGPTTLENLQTLCQPCNSAKGTMSQDDWEHMLATGEIRGATR